MSSEEVYKIRKKINANIWGRESLTNENSLRANTVGSKITRKSEKLQKNLSYRLPNETSIFQAAVLVISQATLMPLGPQKITSILVNQCKKDLSRLGSLSDITLIWVPAHRNHNGNDQADRLANARATLDIIQDFSRRKTPRCS